MMPTPGSRGTPLTELTAQSRQSLGFLAVRAFTGQKTRFLETARSVEPMPHLAFGPLLPAATLKSVGRFYSRAELLAERQRWKRGGKTVVFTNGCYDLLHPGHVRLLEQAR